MRKLRAAAFNVAFYAWTTFMLLVCWPIILMPRAWMVGAMAFWAKGVMALLRWLAAIDYEMRGREHIPEGACIVAAKHQSAWDTIVFHFAVPDPAVVMKRELMSIPIYGWLARRVGMIPVDREGGGAALKAMIVAARRAAAAGRPIVIFPQGTRVAPGKQAPYLPGVAALYRDLKLPVVPVAVNSGCFWPRRSFTRRPGLIVLEFLPPIGPGLSRDDFTHELEQRIETASNKLLPADIFPQP
jgi:1-acyl-sn-glycerol-3-phosphate acyltransferase